MLLSMFLNPARLVLTLFLAMGAGCASSPGTSNAPASTGEALGPPRLVVLYASDLHGRLRGDPVNGGGYARLASVIRAERAKAPAGTDVLAIMGGDAAGKSVLPCRKTQEKSCFPLLKEMGFDAAVLGNGELKLPLDELNSLIKASGLVWIGTNVRASGSGEWQTSWLYEGAKSGAKIWVSGWSVAPTPGEVDLKKNRLAIRPRWNSADFSGWAKKFGNTPVLWTTHQERADDESFLQDACATSGLKSLALLKANDHQQLEIKDKCAPLFEPGPFGRSLSRLVFDKSGDTWTLSEHSFINLGVDSPEDESVKAQIDKLYKERAPEAEEVVAKLEAPLDQPKLTQWLADSFRKTARADVAIVNTGAVKSGIDPGPVSRENLLLAIPYSDDLMGLDWSFKDLEKSLCKASQRSLDPFEDYGSDLVLSGASLVAPGTAECRLETGRKGALKVVMVSFMVRRSGRWLGKDVSPVAFRFGFKSEDVMFAQLKKTGFQ
jgi:2',3'-cyclic-nucleotide 2'-phosphodiesterase (5'-nucleotidase family)